MAEIILVIFGIFLVRIFLNRNMPRVGGKIGALAAADPPPAVPDGFSRVYARIVTVFTASSDAARFSSLKAFLRHGTAAQPTLMRIYRVAACETEIEIPAAAPGYERIDAAEALALLRELPDLRLIRRLQLSDEPSFHDPWVRKVRGPEVFLLGHSTNSRLVVLYKPDRKLGQLNGLTLLHEWLHLAAFISPADVRRFKRANAIEPIASAAIESMSVGVRDPQIHEAWCDLGEKIFGYDETIARGAALSTPAHTMILWRRVETLLRSTPPALRSTRFAQLESRGDFMRSVIAERASTAARDKL
jgi:hypothetical protein